MLSSRAEMNVYITMKGAAYGAKYGPACNHVRCPTVHM